MSVALIYMLVFRLMNINHVTAFAQNNLEKLKVFTHSLSIWVLKYVFQFLFPQTFNVVETVSVFLAQFYYDKLCVRFVRQL